VRGSSECEGCIEKFSGDLEALKYRRVDERKISSLLLPGITESVLIDTAFEHEQVCDLCCNKSRSNIVVVVVAVVSQ
jgi:hypothetical protein